MREINRIKLIAVGLFTAFNSLLGALAIPFYILVGANIVDYLTGVFAAVYRGEKVCSDVGFHGIAKKICMWLLVAIGYTLDYCLLTVGDAVGITASFDCLVAVATVFWLLCNELISILENINDIGAPMPGFLMKLAQYVRSKTEQEMETEK